MLSAGPLYGLTRPATGTHRGVVSALLQEDRPPGAGHRLRCVSLRYARGPAREHEEGEAEEAAGLRPPLVGDREGIGKPMIDKRQSFYLALLLPYLVGPMMEFSSQG